MIFRTSSLAHSLGILAALAVLFAGCADSIQPLESPRDPAVETPVETPTDLFPPVSGSAEVYDRESPTSFGALSRYVLYGDGTFELQYVSASRRYFAYPGEYSREGSKLAFAFDADSRWKATGTLDATRLNVEYNIVMALSDFEDGVYILREGHSTSP